MNEKTLELLCKKLGTTVEYLIPKVQAYGIWTNAIVAAVCCLAVVLEIWYILHLRKKYGDELGWRIDESEFMFVLGGMLLSIIAVITFCVAISELIMWATVPELGLLKFVK